MPPETNDQMVTGTEIGDEDLQQWLTSIGDGVEIQLPSLAIGDPPPRAQEGNDDNGNQDDPNEPDPNAAVEDDNEPPEGTQTPEQVEGVDYFTVNGNRFERADIERLYNFDQYLRANPDTAQRVNDAIAPRSTPPPTGTGQTPVSETPTDTEFKAPEPPEFLDLEDPVQKFQWDSHVGNLKAIHERDERDKKAFAAMAADRQEQQNRQAASDMQTALGTFKSAHPNLNDDDIAKIRQAAVPFVEGMMKQLPPVDALTRSMEVAAVMDNDLRDKMMDPTVRTRSEREQSRHRKNKAGQIAGSPRSAPRTEPSRPAFTSDKEMLNELAAAFSEQMQR